MAFRSDWRWDAILRNFAFFFSVSSRCSSMIALMQASFSSKSRLCTAVAFVILIVVLATMRWDSPSSDFSYAIAVLSFSFLWSRHCIFPQSWFGVRLSREFMEGALTAELLDIWERVDTLVPCPLWISWGGALIATPFCCPNLLFLLIGLGIN